MMAVGDMRPVYYHTNMVDIKEEVPFSDSGSKSSAVLHSGHFMVSRVHDVNKDEDEEELDAALFDDDPKGFDFFTASRETCTTYNFSDTNNQPVSIDASLTKLFECMTLAYSGKITSPKWKQFRGLHLSQKQRIRLNNLIWREWHLQYIYGKRPMVCQFATPLSDHIHSKPEAVVLEGKYWKRQLDTVTAEYKNWRRYFRERLRHHQGFNFKENFCLSESELLERVKELTFIPNSAGSYMSSTDLNLLGADVMDMDLTNELFASLNQPFAFPNPRELSQLGCADLIQPGLVQLQPNLEEFMDIDSMQELFSIRMPSFYSAFTADSTSASDLSMAGFLNSETTLENFLRGSSPVAASNSSLTTDGTMNSSQSSALCENTTPSFLPDSPGPAHKFQLTEDNQYHTDPTIFWGTTLPQDSPQTVSLVPGGLYGHNSADRTSTTTSLVPGGLYGHTSADRTSTAMSSTELLAHLIERQQQSLDTMLTSKRLSPQQLPKQIQPAPSLNQQRQQMFQPTASQQNPLLRQSLSFLHQPQTRPRGKQIQQAPNVVNKSLMARDSMNRGGTVSSAGVRETMPSASKRKESPFAVPMSKPMTAQRKSQVATSGKSAAPSQQAMVSQPTSSQVSYLAELLKNGTYPGAIVSVKNESQLSTVASMPIKTTTNFYQHASPSYNSACGHNLPGTIGVSNSTANQMSHRVLPDAVNSGSNCSTEFDALSQSSVPPSLDAPLSRASLSSARYSRGAESKLLSVSLVPGSSVASPPVVKNAASPAQPMDMGSFLDPSSSFSPAMQLSPSSTVFEGTPGSPDSEGSPFPRENRRTSHLSAEQKRRCNLKTGFDLLQQLVPALSQNPKVSKATMLQKTAEYCKRLKAERAQMHKEAAILKEEIDALNSAISTVQSQLPETGVPVTRQRKDQMTEMFDEYVRVRTNENCKFWIFSMLMSTLYDSYCNTVSTSSMEDLCRTSLTWQDQSCSLVTLRPNVLNALRKLSTSTPILTEPQRMRQHALQVVARKAKGQRSNNMMIK